MTSVWLAPVVWSERRESCFSEGASGWFENVDEFEIQSGKEEYFGRSGVEVGMNEFKFRIGISLEVEEFIGEEGTNVLALLLVCGG